ncbi:peptide chain release factor 2-like [Hippopotamus amphibius kiboko]|uniref:peptide chain release factor 2-like n=1 Tax=Hippopotamus amphibius kiboko TaxID=575201 RepID=UPI0025981F69|nr:peptide chain release factor 2-like [Hippopotamus amphibius kiboko]
MQAGSLPPPTPRGGDAQAAQTGSPRHPFPQQRGSPPWGRIPSAHPGGAVGEAPAGPPGLTPSRLGSCPPPPLWVQPRQGDRGWTAASRDSGAHTHPAAGWRPRGARRCRRLQTRFKGQRRAEGSLPLAHHGSIRREQSPQQRRPARREPKRCSSARPRALLFVSFHRSRAASERLTGGGDASAAREARLRGYEVRAPGHRRRHARRREPERGVPRPAAASGPSRPRARRARRRGGGASTRPEEERAAPGGERGAGAGAGRLRRPAGARLPGPRPLSGCRRLGSPEKASGLLPIAPAQRKMLYQRRPCL